MGRNLRVRASGYLLFFDNFTARAGNNGFSENPLLDKEEGAMVKAGDRRELQVPSIEENFEMLKSYTNLEKNRKAIEHETNLFCKYSFSG